MADTRTARYLDLFDQIAEEEGAPKHGYRKRTADRLGIHPTYVTVLSDKKRRRGIKVTEATTDLASRRLGVQPTFFRAPRKVDYREYIRESALHLPDLNDPRVDLASALEHSEGWDDAPPTPWPAREFASRVETWAAGEIRLLEKLAQRAREIHLAFSDAKASRAAAELRFAVWQRYGATIGAD
jgi:hypothetical protein